MSGTVIILGIIIGVIVILLIYFLSENHYSLISNNRFVVSLTSTPQRINKIIPTLRSLLYQTHPPEMIYLCLPEKFRNTDPYPDLSVDLERVKIVRTPEDYGPATKLIGVLPHIKEDEDLFILYCDDDINYPEDMIAVHNRMARKSSVNGACVHPQGFLEAFAGISVHRSSLKEDLIPFVQEAGKCLDCYLSDDLVLGKYFNKHKIPVHKVRSLSYNKTEITKRVFSYGFESDALHQGSNGLTENDSHLSKYARCKQVMDKLYLIV